MAKEGRTRETRIIHRCADCGFRIRGDNHNEGIHHKSGGKGKGKAKFSTKRY